VEVRVLQADGLQTDPNRLSSVSPGAIVDGVNVACDRINIYEKARGFRTCAIINGICEKYFEYQGSTLLYYKQGGITQTLAYDSTGNCDFVDYGAMPSTGYPSFSSKAKNNIYFTSDEGIKKLDQLTGPLMQSGVPRGLSGTYQFIASTGNVIQNNFKTAYRIVWGYTDANDNLILGAPSPRIAVTNTSGVTQDVELTVLIPDEITTTNYFYQVYRSLEVAVPTEPLDEMYLSGEVTITATDIANGFIVFQDNTSVDDLGATIYTAPSQQGIQNSYYQPPHALDIGTFDTVTFFANTKTKQSVITTLLKVQSTGFGFTTTTGDTVGGSPIIINVVSTANVVVGQSISGTDIPPDTFVLSKTLNTITISNPAIGSSIGVVLTLRDFIQVGTEIYIASNTNNPITGEFNVNTTDIEQATNNFINVLNEASPDYYGYYLGIGDIDKGQFQIEAISLADPSFVITTSQPSSFSPNLPITSTNEDYGNRMYFSLPDQPESVPIVNYIDIGSTRENFIERYIVLRDSWFVFLSNGDVWKGIGNTRQSIAVRLFNSNSKLRGIQLPAILDNNIFCFTDQGVTVVNENGIDFVSLPIERSLFKISKTRNSTFEDVSFGIGYESDRKYIMFVPEDSDNEVANIAFVYNVLTQKWAKLKRDANFGFWNVSEDKLYIGTDIVKMERKEYNETDFSEDQFSVEITSISDYVITLADASSASIGDSLYQNGVKAKITQISGNDITVTKIGFLIGDAVIYQPMEFSFSYVPQHMGDVLIDKFQQEIFHYVDNVDFESFIQIIGNEVDSSISTEEVVVKTDSTLQPVRTTVPREQTRCRWINLTISQSEACTGFEYLGYVLLSDPVSERSK